MDPQKGNRDANKLQPYMIGITGPSCSGKTALAKHLMKKLGQNNCLLIQLDSYYRDLSHLTLKEIEAHNYDHPGALEKKLLIEHISTIAAGDEIEIPLYDYVTHTRARKKILVKPMKFILVEGLFTFYWERLRKIFNTKVFISVKNDVCFNRRLERDIKDRGATLEYVSKQYATTVRPMYEQFIKPNIQYADVVVNGEYPTEESAITIIHHINKQ